MKFEVGKTYKIKDTFLNKKVVKTFEFVRSYREFYLFHHTNGYRECFLKQTENILWEVI